jgi:superfamily I DNA/RNA helicase
MTMKLNEQQREAATSEADQILTIACPGSGKTRTLIGRIIHLLQLGQSPTGIAAVTFTNAAAGEILRRVEEQIGSKVRLGHCGTLHSLMLKIISRSGRKGFNVIDQEQAEAMLAEAVQTMRFKGSLAALRDALRATRGKVPARSAKGQLEITLAAFVLKLRSQGLMTFDMLLEAGLRAIRERDRSWFPFEHLVVDEYQDSAEIDSEIYGAMPCQTKFFVGDPRQSIYSFRGGSHSSIMAFAARPDVETHQLGINFRSSPEIVDFANRLIAGAKVRYSPIRSGQEPSGEPVGFTEHASEGAEVAAVAEQIRSVPEGESCAMLLRSNHMARQWADDLKRHGIQVAAKEETDLPDDWRKVRDYAALVVNPDNDALAAMAISHSQGKETAEQVRRSAMQQLKTINEIALRMTPASTVGEAVKTLLKMGVSAESVTILKGIENRMADEQAGDLILALAEMTHQSKEIGQGVVVTTYHAAKGREWDNVWLPSVEDAFLPGSRKGVDIEEERRVFYVGVTRAKNRLSITWATARKNRFTGEVDKTVPSRFICEMKI